MSSIKPALERAKAVLSGNTYFALATQDENGPWVATLAYTIAAPHGLYFFSQKTSRHGRAILNGHEKVAGVIYDSRCTAEEAESLQFSGLGKCVHDREHIAAVLKANGSKVSDVQIDEALQSESTLLFCVTLNDAYVLDQKLFAAEGIDAREAVAVVDLF